MRKFDVYFVPEAKEDLQFLNLKLQKKILQKLEWLSSNIDKVKLIPLYGKLSGFYKLRFGNYRIIYKVDWINELVIVYVIKHRKEVYRGS